MARRRERLTDFCVKDASVASMASNARAEVETKSSMVPLTQNLACISRFTSSSHLHALGRYFGSDPSRAVANLPSAFKDVDYDHYLPLLYVVDATLKYSKASFEAVKPLLKPLLFRRRPFPELDAMVVHWYELNALRRSWAAEYFNRGGTQICPNCSGAFSSKEELNDHLDLHFRERFFVRFEMVKQRRIRGWILGDDARKPCDTTGFFEGRRLEEVRSAPCPEPVHSPVLLAGDEDATCFYCGEDIEKFFDDRLNDWVTPETERTLRGLCHVECREYL